MPSRADFIRSLIFFGIFFTLSIYVDLDFLGSGMSRFHMTASHTMYGLSAGDPAMGGLLMPNFAAFALGAELIYLRRQFLRSRNLSANPPKN